jgi:hypothetical protein
VITRYNPTLIKPLEPSHDRLCLGCLHDAVSCCVVGSGCGLVADPSALGGVIFYWLRWQYGGTDVMNQSFNHHLSHDLL